MGEAATEYVRLMTEFQPGLNPMVLDGIQVFDVGALRRLLAPLQIPARQNTVFDIIRSDFGETLAYLTLEDQFSTQIAVKAVRTRERQDLPARGIDIVGIEHDDVLRLVLAEVKVSDEDASPPQVVAHGNDCLSAQLAHHVSHREETQARLARIALQTPDVEVRDKILAAMLYWGDEAWDRLEIVCCGIMLRSAQVYHVTDFGALADDQSALTNASLRFLIVITPWSIDETVRRWYAIISAGVRG